MKTLLVFLFLAATIATAADSAPDLCNDTRLSDSPVLSEGRAMPLALHAERIRRALFSGDRCAKAPASELYCRLSLGKKDQLETKYNCKLQLKADHPATFELLELPNRSTPILPELALAKQQKLLAQYHLYDREGKTSSGPGSDLSSLLTRVERYASITSGKDWQILLEGHEWKPVASIQENPARLMALVLESGDRMTPDEKNLLSRQWLYERTHPFSIAILFAILGLVVTLGAGKSKNLDKAALVVMGLLIATELYGITLRVLISGRAPVTNMFETVMWVGFCVLILSLILGLKMKNRSIWGAGFAGNAITLFMLNFATSMLDNNIQPLVPVLRDNFWLSTHVTCVTASYACFAFSWLLANFVLLKRLAGNKSVEFLERWNYVMRAGMQIGAVMLAAGIILGGVWADYSWGRFWGWDPKETWSLIALVIYIGILHGRYVGWFRGPYFTFMAAGAFLSVIMSWFGVNYILAVGLHSYGFSSGGALFIASITVFQLVVLGLSYLKEMPKKSRRR